VAESRLRSRRGILRPKLSDGSPLVLFLFPEPPRPSPSLFRQFPVSGGGGGAISRATAARGKDEAGGSHDPKLLHRSPEQTLVLHLKRQWMKPISTLKPVLRAATRRRLSAAFRNYNATLSRERRASSGDSPGLVIDT